MKPKKTLTLLLISSLTTSWAAPLTVNIDPTGTSVALTSTEPILYQLENSLQSLVLKNTELPANTPLPLQLTATQLGKDLWIKINNNVEFGLTSNQTTLLIRQKADTAVRVNPRAPLFIPIDNAEPTRVAALLLRMYNGIQVEVDERQSALLVMVGAQDEQLIKDVVKQLDTTRPQVMFEAQIIEINQNMTEALGIQYDQIFSFKISEGDVPGIAKLGKIARDPFKLNFKLNALFENQAAKVLAQPRVTTLDRQEARINATKTTPILLGSEGGSQNVQSLATGIQMRMTPKIASDGTIEANLTISVSIPGAQTSQGLTQYSTREATTTVRVKNGEPIVIGGLLETRDSTTVDKIPVLGDIPLIGGLFRNTRTESQKTDLMIIVTPRIIYAGESDDLSYQVTPTTPLPAPLPTLEGTGE